ncbi:hypothetical protein SAMN05192553_108122 [Cyclobacterium xiamenense]|uniref:HpcH/HpaI aldolase/citrate lyase domain-containing protein n=1 Tax=Cyclobacterium xiamenense TaxID=1297121 RepID=A0A1H7AYD0_9BACT|nr:hypothetical protein [Cyclobacterium xiamenense]SEJ68927.1 hypothetical protein SAMN05192553_108122 [Cyclobacterium xiamenense]
MDRVLFGDNQFFGVNHSSDEKSRAQTMKFQKDEAILKVLDTAIDEGINTFMCTTHDRIANICEVIRTNDKYNGFQIFPCMPYAHKYANAVTELGYLGTIKQFVPGNIFNTFAKGGLAFVKKDFSSLAELMIDAELKMFKGIKTPVIWVQNVITDLLLGLGMTEFLVTFYRHVKEKHQAEPGFITMNLPLLLDTLEKAGIENPTVCASINKIGFRMSGGKEKYEEVIAQKRCKLVAMQVLAAGALPPAEALEYVCSLDGVESILFGASSRANIHQTKTLIDTYSRV